MFSPPFVVQFEMLPKNSLGSLVVENQTLCDGLKALGYCRLRAC
jgi:hypothetical protein